MITDTTNTETTMDLWSAPERVEVIEHIDRVEFVYKQVSSITFTTGHYQQPLGTRCYKIVFSVFDGKWHKSEPIFGIISPQKEETYEFPI